MKVFKLLFVFFFFFACSCFASNPGSNYGCLSYESPAKLYTNWTNTATSSPTDPGWHSNFQCYDTNPQVYTVIYGPVSCGEVNPSSTLQNASYEGQNACFILIGGNYVQGGLRTFTTGTLVPCPIDDDVWVLIFAFGAIGGLFIVKK